jgi:cell division septation protein DedD
MKGWLMSLSNTLGSRNVWVLFFSALSISLLVLLLLFSFFFKNLDFNVKTKALDEAPTLETGINMQSTEAMPAEEEGLDPQTLSDRVQLNVPEEAGRLRNKAFAKKKTDPYVGLDAPKSKKNATSTLAPTPASAPSPSTTETETTAPSPVATVKPVTPTQKFRVYLGGFFSRGDAEATQSRLKAQGYNSIIKQSSTGFEVQLGLYDNEDTAKNVASSTGASLEGL